MTIRFRSEGDELGEDERASQRIYMGSALTMEPGTMLQQQQLPLHNDFSLSSDPECLGQFSGHPHHSPYNSNGSIETMRRDASLVQQSPGALAYTSKGNTPGARYVPGRNVAPDGRSYTHTHTQNFADSGSGSISTSPSSAASSLVYNNYQQAAHYTGCVPTYPTPEPLPQSFVSPSYVGARVSSTLDSTAQSLLPLPNRSPLSGAASAIDRDVYTNPSPYLARTQLSPTSQANYPQYADPSRGILSAGLPLTALPGSGYPAHMASPNAHNYSPLQNNESLNFPWPTLEVLLELHCEGIPVTPEVHAKVEKGFFVSPGDSKWTCYRRNYFAVNCNFELHPHINNGNLTIKRNNVTERVVAMGMRLAAAVDGAQGKSIELIQHTPKRDNGPRIKMDVVRVSPASSGRVDSTISPHGIYQMPMHTYHPTGHTPGPNLPFQTKPDDSQFVQTDPPSSSTYGINGGSGSHMPPTGSNTSHTFERVQFKQATANNGKRRASQQYFHLVVELFVDIRKSEHDQPIWVKIAQRVSEKIVVRGRSPSHYQSEGQNGSNGRGGAAGSNGGYSTAGASFNGMNAGGFRSSGSHYSSSLSGGSNGYRSTQYALNMHADQVDSHSGSSSSSIDGGPADGYQMDTMLSDADRMAIQEHEGYQYYPSTIYEGMPTQLPPLGRIESNARFSTEPRQYAVKTEYSDAMPGAQYTASGVGRFQGVDSSRGYYPDLQAGCG